MAVSTITNLSNSLRRVYADRFFKAFQNDLVPLLDEFDECKDEPTRGVGWFFPFYFNSPQNWRVNAEAGAMGTVRQRSEVQGQVNAVEFIAWVQLSEMLKNAATKDAAWLGGEVNRQVKEAVTDVTKGMQRMLSISHGTGRLAVVEANTVAANTFTAKLDEGTSALMEGDAIDFFNLDSGGALQGTAAHVVTKINRRTRLVTFDGPAETLTANWGVYKTGDYGRGINGFHGMIDDGTFQDLLHGQSRTTNEKLKAQVRDPGSPQELAEQDMREVCDDIFLIGGEIDHLQCNVGVMNAFFDINSGDRRYNIERGQTAKYILGYREGDALWSYDKGTVVIKKNPNLPARSLYFYSLKAAFMKHTLRKLGWLDEGGSILRLTPNGQGFETSWTAITCAQENFSCPSPCWNGLRKNIKDKTLAGDV